MSQPEYYAILDECVSRIRRGESAKACLADYPSQVGLLAPDLALTAELIQLPLLEPTPEAVAEGYERMMAALETTTQMSARAALAAFVNRVASGIGRQRRGLAATALRAVVVALVLVVVAGGFVVTAAADTLPGDALYPVKRSWEDARLALTLGDSSREALRSDFEERRRDEVQAVQELRRPVDVDFSGIVESLDTGLWRVDGLELIITADTEVIGAVGVGQSITVRALVKDDGTLNAVSVSTEDDQPLPPEATPTLSTQPTRPATPTATAPATRDVIAPSPTPTPAATRPAPTPTGRPTLGPTRTPAPSSVDSEPTRDTRPTNTPSTDSLATSAPRPTATPANSDPTPTRGTVDVAPSTPTPTPTAQTGRDLATSRTPTPTREAKTGD